MRKFQFFSSFFIKVFAILFMTLDHVGVLLKYLYPYSNDINVLAMVLRSFGRLALPLFIFMIVEGVIHTKSIKKYFIRLGAMAILISTVIAIITYVDFSKDTNFIEGSGNIFLDLLLVALSIYLLRNENKNMRWFILLPISISILSFIVKCLENSNNIIIHWYPTFLYLHGDWYSLFLGIGFYLSYNAAKAYIDNQKETQGIDPSIWEANGNYRLLVGGFQIIVLFIGSILLYLFKYLWPTGVYWDVEIQLCAIISGAFILLYNGKRGYNAKWFQYGAYLYYPLHILLLGAIYLIISGGL